MNWIAIAQRLNAIEIRGASQRAITGVVGDSRQVRPGHLFVAIAGHEQAGIRYVEDALQRGAAAIVTDVTEHAINVPAGVGLARVADARVALALASKAFWQDAVDRLQVVGVTGTNGKTTTAYLVRDILEAAGRGPGLISTVQYRVGARAIPAVRTTPDATLLHRLFSEIESGGGQSVVVEVSSHALDQQRVAGIDFDVAIFTNLTRDHLDYHHGMEAYFEAKARLFQALGTGRKPASAVINVDNPWGQRLLREGAPGVRQLTYGLKAAADVTAEALRLSPHGSHFQLKTPWGTADLQSGLLGRFNVSNALAAAGAAGALGIGLDAVVAALQAAQPPAGRLQAVPTGRDFLVFVDYAHTDDALACVLETVREVAAGRVIVVFGCGGDRDVSKRPAMGAVAERLADLLVVTSDNPRREAPMQIIEQILAGVKQRERCTGIADRREAIAHALAVAGAGDVVLIAGKGHETFQEFANRIVPFDDVQVVRDLVAGGSRA